MAGTHWNDVLQRRTSRRRALAASAGSTAALAFLAACGGSSGEGTGSASNTAKDSGLVSSLKDSLKEAKHGGVLKDFSNSEPAHLDAMQPLASLNFQARNVYGTLLREKPGYLKPSESVVGGDLAESWEFSPDHLQITMKLRPGVKWHNKPPVNARLVDKDDVLFTWKRYLAQGALRDLIANAVNPDAPVLSLEAPDAKTIVIKLKEPVVWAAKYFASYGSFTGNSVIYPREADGGFDVRNEMIGHGPWQMVEHRPSVGFKFKRNADYYDKEAAFPDELEMPIITDYAQQLAQLKTGNIHFYVPPNLNLDIAGLKKEEPKLQIYAFPFTPRTEVLTFGTLPAGNSPFKDERVRQAVSMSLDRDTWIDAVYNVSKNQGNGLPMETRWNTHIQAEWKPSGHWLDPKGKDFGPNAKYFQYNLAEAKKLLAAAGFGSGFSTTSHYPASVQYTLQRYAEPTDGMIQELGVKLTLDPMTDYTKQYIPNLRDANGQFEGYGYHSVTGSTAQRISPESDLAAQFWPKGGVTFHGFSTSGKNDKSGDPALSAIIEKARTEFDENARKKLVHDAQRYLGKAMWAMSAPGGANTFHFAWPAVGNYLAWQGPAAYWTYHLWLDRTKAPFS